MFRQYKKVPHLPDDTLPSLDELPQLVRSIGRGRSDSVGPQSAADAYETLAYREKRRRDSMDKINRPQSPLRNARSLAGDLEKYENQMGTGEVDMSALGEGSHDEEYEQREVFRKIEPFKPRVRYDVEVVTKLIVYSGKFVFLVLLRGKRGWGGGRLGQHAYCCHYRNRLVGRRRVSDRL